MKRRLFAFLLALPAVSLLFFETAERRYNLGIEGCESGGVKPLNVELYGGCFRPLATLYAGESCSCSGNLMEMSDPRDYHVYAPAGEYQVDMGAEDSTIRFIHARLKLPTGERQDSFSLSLWGEPYVTGYRIYRLEDFKPWGYPFCGYSQEPQQNPATALFSAEGSRAEQLTLPFGSYVIEAIRKPDQFDNAPVSETKERRQSFYSLNIRRR